MPFGLGIPRCPFAIFFLAFLDSFFPFFEKLIFLFVSSEQG